RPQCSFDSSAGIIAVFHALPRLLAPRHPPHALSSLTAPAPPSGPRRHTKAEPAGPATGPAAGGRARSNDPFGSLEFVQRSLARNCGAAGTSPAAPSFL